MKIDAKGSIDELNALYNILNAADLVYAFKPGRLRKDKSLVNGKQSFEVCLHGALHKDTRREVPTRRDKAGDVYLLETPMPGVYKIGQTVDFQDRKATFNVKLPFDVKLVHLIHCEDRFATEAALKRKFARQQRRLNGSEFFQLSEADVAFICSL